MKKLNNLSLILIYGPAGSGKTTLADVLHSELSYTAHIGVDHIKRFISEFRDIPSHQNVSKKVINAMSEEYLRNNISVIIEQGMDRKEIENLKELADKYKADFFVYRLDVPRHILVERVAERTTKLGKPEIPKEVIEDLLRIHQDNDYSNTQTFDSEKLEARQKADLILRDLKLN